MNLLAFDTSTEIMSIAVQRGCGTSAQLWQHNGPGSAQTSTHLIPAILALLTQANLQLTDLQAIVFGAGPGSFTGLRTACAVAQGLGFGSGLPVLPVSTLLAVAEQARWQLGAPQTLAITALLDARMDEWYTADYVFDSGKPILVNGYSLIKPECLCWSEATILAGNVFAVYVGRRPDAAHCVSAWPTAAALLRLAPAMLSAGLAVPAEQALPMYVRDKVAQTTLERASLQAVLPLTVP